MLEWFNIIKFLTEHFPTWVVVLMIPVLLAVGVLSMVGVQIIILFTADFYRKYIRPIFNFPEPPAD